MIIALRTSANNPLDTFVDRHTNAHLFSQYFLLCLPLTQGKCLCGQYIRARLRRAGYLNRKVTQRLRTLIDPSATIATRDIFPTLNAVSPRIRYLWFLVIVTILFFQMGQELERMHPRVYTNVSRQLSRTPFGELADADAAPFLLHATAKEMFKAPGVTGQAATAASNASVIITTTTSTSSAVATAVDPQQISWPKIVSLFVVCAALAVDIVRQGHYDYLPRLLEGTADIIDEDLAAWIQGKAVLKKSTSGDNENALSTDGAGICGGGGGSWLGLVQYFRPPSTDAGTGVADLVYTNWLSVAAGGLVTMYILMFAVQVLSEWCWTCLVGPAS